MTALSFTLIGFNIGLLTIGPLLQVLLDSVGWRSTFRVIAGVVATSFLFGCTYHPNKSNAGDKERTTCEEALDIGSNVEIDLNNSSSSKSAVGEKKTTFEGNEGDKCFVRSKIANSEVKDKDNETTAKGNVIRL